MKIFRYRCREITIHTKHAQKIVVYMHATHTYIHQVRNKKLSKIYFRAYSLSYGEIDIILKILFLYLLYFPFYPD